MTQEEYRKRNNIENFPWVMPVVEEDLDYKCRHSQRLYQVYRVLSAIGPEETQMVWGRDNALEMIKGCWDWCVTDVLTGNEIA